MALAIGFLGGVSGSILGYLAATWWVCRDGGGAYGESCGMGLLILPFLGVLIGAVIGVIVGAVIGYRLPAAGDPTPNGGTDAAGDP